MKKYVLGLFATAIVSSFSLAQSIEIHDDGEVLVSPESVVDGVVGAAAVYQGYYIVNVSDTPVDFSWQRLAEFSQSCLDDQVCTDDSCYPSSYDVPVFNSPDPLTLAAGDSTYFKVGASSADVACCAIHKYYLKTGLGVTQDSITVKFRIGATECFLSVEEPVKAEEFSLYPNPANNMITLVASANFNGATFSLHNVVGEKVVIQNINVGKNSINIENLPSGIYFYSIIKEGELMETKKLIVKH